MKRIEKLIRELSKESFRMMIPYTLIILVISAVNMIFFEIIVNNLFAFIAYIADVDVIATGTLETVLKHVYTYPLFLILFTVIGIAIFMQYVFLINIINRIYVSRAGVTEEKVISKARIKEIFFIFVKKIRFVPVLIYFVYFVLLLSLFGINIENLIVERINMSDVITSVIYSNYYFTAIFILFKVALLVLIGRLTPFIFIYSLKDYSVKESLTISNTVFRENMKSIFLFLIVIFMITAASDMFSYYIGDSLFYTIYANSDVLHFREGILFFISLPLLIMDEFLTILFLLFFIHIFFDDDNDIDVENKGFSKVSNTIAYKVLTIAIVFALVFTEYVSYQVVFEGTDMSNSIMVHRGGGHEVFENTKESIEYSISKGFPAVEIDTMELKDGTIVLVHDKNLTRIADKDINISDLTLEEIKDLKMIGGYEFITLDEALDLVLNEDIIVNIEIKYHGEESENYVSNIVDIVESKSLENRIYISSFDYDSLLEVEDLNSEIKTMYFSFFFLGNLTNLQVDAVGVDITYLSTEQFNTLKKSGYEIAIFTVNKKKDMLSSLSYELDYIISDEPESLEELIEGISDIFSLK